jgi:hypothetical protein
MDSKTACKAGRTASPSLSRLLILTTAVLLAIAVPASAFDRQQLGLSGCVEAEGHEACFGASGGGGGISTCGGFDGSYVGVDVSRQNGDTLVYFPFVGPGGSPNIGGVGLGTQSVGYCP